MVMHHACSSGARSNPVVVHAPTAHLPKLLDCARGLLQRRLLPLHRARFTQRLCCCMHEPLLCIWVHEHIHRLDHGHLAVQQATQGGVATCRGCDMDM